jgi:P-type E1-E2 ATPase
VTRLDAIEDAATMDVLCADKTGTITMNRFRPSPMSSSSGSTKEEVIPGALAANEANQDSIDLASSRKRESLNFP